VPKSSRPSNSAEVQVEGRTLSLSNLDKNLFPSGFSKGQVIHYYTQIAPHLLAHLRGRPLTLKRYPNGSQGEYFYEKNCPKHRPPWINTVRVYSEGNQADMDYCEVGDLASLTWVANLASLELHTSLSLGSALQEPTVLAFDLDPGAPADVLACGQVALWIRDLLEPLGLKAFAKTSGNKGLQVYVPLNGSQTYDVTKPFANAVARLMEERHPDRVTSEMKKSLRPGKVFIDWSQNDAHKTTVCVYSLRARERPTVSTPVTWQEVAKAIKAGDPTQLTFEAPEVLRRVKKHGDLFAEVQTLEQKVPHGGV
jgi:bifunctional non-homologous end joining protein LigD